MKLAARAAFVLVCVGASASCAAKDEPAKAGAEKAKAAVAEPPDFHFQYLVVPGPPPVPAELTIEGLDARLLRRRADPETEGAAIGLFRDKLKPEEVHAIEAATPGKLEYDGPPIAPGTPTVYVKLKSGPRTTELRIPIDPGALASIAPLTAALERLEKRLLEHPVRALKIELLPHPEPLGAHNVETFKAALINPGSEPLKLDLTNVKWKFESTTPPPPPDPKVTALPTVWAFADGAPAKPEAIEIKPGGRAEIELTGGVANPGPLLARIRATLPGGEGSIEGEALSASIRVEAK